MKLKWKSKCDPTKIGNKFGNGLLEGKMLPALELDSFPMRNGFVLSHGDKSVLIFQGICYIEEAAVPVIVNSSDILVHVRAASIDTIDLEVASERGRVLRELFQNKSLVMNSRVKLFDFIFTHFTMQ